MQVKGGQIGTRLDMISFDAPIVRRVFPSNGPTLGVSLPITLEGANFGKVRPSAAKVTIGQTVRAHRTLCGARPSAASDSAARRIRRILICPWMCNHTRRIAARGIRSHCR
jgi:hypothetical protein